jgi:membrane dipeptidase
MMHFSRRRLVLGGAALASSWAAPVWPQTPANPRLPIADAHSHIGMFRPTSRRLKDRMLESGVSLLAWAVVGDTRWTARTRLGIEQRSTPGPGEQALYLGQRLARIRKKLASEGLDCVQVPADIEAARAGSPRVVLTLEGAGMAEDGLDGLDTAWRSGLRHVQLVHYVRNELGDIQTAPPVHGTLTDLGVQVIDRCHQLGILVDLAHCAPPCVNRALEVARKPLIWSHSAISLAPQSWREPSNRSRLLEARQARRIAAGDGAVGLWALQDTVHSSPLGYADEILRMIELLGPAHVMFGTDIEGMGNGAAMHELTDLRDVVDELARRGLDEATLRGVCFENYARCLDQALRGRA